MKYTDYIEANQGFQTSVNLEFDLNNKDKIRNYIPTEQSVKVLNTFLKSFYYERDTQNRANVLIGPYGRGKSHLLLVLTALTSLDILKSDEYSSNEAYNIQYELCDKISVIDAETGALAKTIVDSDIRTLPIIINSNSRDINQSFLVALSNSLLIAGLSNLLPKTYFDSAIEVIERWESDYPEAYKKLTEILKVSKTTVRKLQIGLKQYNNDSYDLFCQCYPEIAVGTMFNPLVNMDVIKLYMSVVDALHEQSEYVGINIIFDEFSKFLESNLDKTQMYNFKIIQDLAEAASRSGKKQIHFTCITHKDISEYSSSDSFKTVEGRFSKVYFVSSSEQSYELISNAIVKKKGFYSYLSKNKQFFLEAINVAALTNVFGEMAEEAFEKKVVFGCFPLAPLTVYALLQVSEIVGQNERTLFTFLASNGENTLGEYIAKERDCVDFLTVETIYDYFEELFKKEIFNVSVHSYWSKANSAIHQVDDNDQIKILKAIAIINIIREETLKTIPSHIKSALLMGDAIFDKASHELQKKHILTQRDSSELVLLTANGVDVQRNIDNQIESKAIRVNICAELERTCSLGFVIPHEYNDKYCMLRFFKKIFLDAVTFCYYANAQQLLSEHMADGLLIYIIDKIPSMKEDILTKINTFQGYPQIIIVLSEQSFDCELTLKKLVAAKQLKEIAINNNDPHYLEEIEYFVEDLQKQVNSAINGMFSPSSKNSKYYNCTGELDINRQASLNHQISTICEDTYSKTPIVNNEMVNKRVLNTQNLKGRNLVVDWIIKHSEDCEIPCMDGFGPEVSIFKSTFKHTGLDKSSKVADSGINEVLIVIKRFIAECEKKRGNFSGLYKMLLDVPYGMRKGIIPLFIAYAIRPYKHNIVLYYKTKEVELSANILSGLNDNPENYEMLLEVGIQDKDDFLDNLEYLFKEYIDLRNNSVNRVYTIVRSMQNWYRSLPEYTKRYINYFENEEEKKVDSDVIIIRNDLAKFDVNSRELLFDDWSRKLSAYGDLNECYSKISNSKEVLDKHISVYRKELTKRVSDSFMPGYQGSLSNALITWYKSLPQTTQQHVFETKCNSILSLAKGINSYDDRELLDSLVNIIEAIAIEDWNDEMSANFLEDISIVVRKINDYKENAIDSSQECRVLITMSGMQVDKTFTTDKISPLGKTVLNNLTSVFDEYNDSLDPDEKLAILTRLIGDVIQ